MSYLFVAIIGLGPRGLTILDRLVEAYRWNQPEWNLAIHVVDPGEEGQGVHRASLPDHLLVNTPGRMITMFPHEALKGAPPRPAGPSLPEWARMQGYRRMGSQYVVCDLGDEISDEDYLPRRLLGEYLSWYFHKIVENLPSGLTVTHNKLRATNVEVVGSEITSIELETGYRLKVDFAFLTTGHGVSKPNDEQVALEQFVEENRSVNSKLLFLRDPYPLIKLSGVDPEATVALQGSGLAAHDIIAELTVGRGGSFTLTDFGLRYLSSGREPRLFLFSRSGLPFCARAINQKKPGALHRPYFFRPDAIKELRDRAIAQGRGDRLDFDQDVLPLMIKEMAYVHALIKRGCRCEPADYEPSIEDLESIERAIDPLRRLTFKDMQAFSHFIVNYLKADLHEAELGNLTSPIKAAVEVIRDSRECLRLAVEFRGLTPESHMRFDQVHQPMMNRLTFGPPMQRNQELLALIEAGIVEIGAGPSATIRTDAQSHKFIVSSKFESGLHSISTDVVILGRLDQFRPERDSSILYSNLLARGIVRPFRNGDYHPFGIDIDRDNHPVMRNGTGVRNLWAVGYPVEGAHFFTHALPLPLLKSRHVIDADRCVLGLFQELASRSVLSSKSTQTSLIGVVGRAAV